MTKKEPFCAFLWLTITALSRQIRSLPTYKVGPTNLFTPLETCLLFLMGRNLCLINDLRTCMVLYYCRETFTNVMSALQIHPFLTNKANFQKSQMNVSDLLIREYVQMDTWSIGKNKAKTNPIQTQTNPIQTRILARSGINQIGAALSDAFSLLQSIFGIFFFAISSE
jgi:hypothetical protein